METPVKQAPFVAQPDDASPVRRPADSAALLLLVLAAVPSLGVGLVYILVFGAGSILGMVFLATAMSIPFAMSAERTARVHQTLRAAAALFSIVLGSTILFELLLV